MNGNEWERQLNKLLKQLDPKKFFFIKFPTPTRLKKKNNNFDLVYSDKALCDFIGINNGQFILIETKTINGKYWETRRLKKHQIEQLSLISNLNGISLIFFYVEHIEKIVIYSIEEYIYFIENQTLNNIPWRKIVENGDLVAIKKEDLEIFFQSILLY